MNAVKDTRRIVIGIMERKLPRGLVIDGTEYKLTEHTTINSDVVDIHFCGPGAEMKLLVEEDNTVLGIQVLRMQGEEDEDE